MAEPAQKIEAAPEPREGARPPTSSIRLERDDGREGAAQREHATHVVRLRRVLGVGLLLWNLIGIPNDYLVTQTFELDYGEFTLARVLSSAVQFAAWGCLFLSPGPRALRWIETTCFVATAAGLAALHHGVAGPTPLFMSCAMLAQGVARPRPWRQGLVQVGATYLTYPLTMLMVEALTHRASEAWADPVLAVAFGRHMLFGAFTLFFVVMGADALERLQRSARKEQRIGQYRLLSKLGGGGMGEVWLARHPGLGQEVALKLAAPGKESLITREADVLTTLSHPVTVRIVDRGRTESARPYFAMERLRGPTLLEKVERDGPMDPASVGALGVAIARALAEAHRLGVVHRDVTPLNVMLTGPRERMPRLIDFGLAVAIGRTDQPGAGNLRFCSEEQRRGMPADPRMDVFALGAVLHFALTGRSPLEGERGERLQSPSLSLQGELPLPLETAIARCLEIDPSDRFVDASALADALKR